MNNSKTHFVYVSKRFSWIHTFCTHLYIYIYYIFFVSLGCTDASPHPADASQHPAAAHDSISVLQGQSVHINQKAAAAAHDSVLQGQAAGAVAGFGGAVAGTAFAVEHCKRFCCRCFRTPGSGSRFRQRQAVHINQKAAAAAHDYVLQGQRGCWICLCGGPIDWREKCTAAS